MSLHRAAQVGATRARSVLWIRRNPRSPLPEPAPEIAAAGAPARALSVLEVLACREVPGSLRASWLAETSGEPRP